ncbi:MAG: hypothetical protein AAFO76_03950 [Cyanobacteria bacterium J06607_15]
MRSIAPIALRQTEREANASSRLDDDLHPSDAAALRGVICDLTYTA